MSTPEERITALETEVEYLRQQLLEFIESSTKVADQTASLAAENAMLSRAITFLGVFWGNNPAIPKGLLADVYSATMEGITPDMKERARRTATNLSFWLK